MYHYSHTIGILSLAGRGFSNPLDLAIGSGDQLYVVNRSNFHQEMISVRVSICTIAGEFTGQFAKYGTEDGQLIWPTAIAIDNHGLIYIADEHRHDIQVFDRDGMYLRKWESLGASNGELNRPAGLAIDADNNVLVSDHLNNRIQKFNSVGELLLVVGDQRNAPDQLNMPWGIATDGQGRIYVADWRNDRVQVFSPEGRYLRTFGSSGSGKGQLRRPAGVAVDDESRVYVADWGNDRVQVFAPDGQALAVLTGDADLSMRAKEWLADNPDVASTRESADLEREKRFWGPTAVKIDRQGRVFVVDSCRHRIQVYQRDA